MGSIRNRRACLIRQESRFSVVNYKLVEKSKIDSFRTKKRTIVFASELNVSSDFIVMR